MEQDQPDKKDMEYLKQLILQQIKSQEEANKSFKKILHRLTCFFVVVAFSILIGIAFIIYTENKPHSIVNEALKTAKDLETRISLQRQYINMNTKDIDDLKDSTKKGK